MELASAVLEAPDEHAAGEALHEAGCTDGLPVIVPTRARVERMVLATGLDADILLGHVGPNMGEATVEKVAINAVMAGCLPDHMPIVVAAVRAVCEPEFDLTEVQSTTHCIAPLVIVHPPAAEACEVAAGWGALGPGHRANATIGRALRLVLTNVGGGRPGVSDMALLGHPGKFTFCLAELHPSPLAPWRDEAAVTVVGVDAPQSVISAVDADDPEGASRLLGSLAAALGNPGTNNAHMRRGTVVVVLNPDHAAVLTAAGYTREKIQAELAARAGNTRGTLRALIPGFTPDGHPDDFLPITRDPEDIVVICAGGGGLYSAVMSSWCAGAHANRAVTMKVDLGQACEIPGLAAT